MKLWLISQELNTGYDTYDSAIVAAYKEADARLIHPRGNRVWHNGAWGYWHDGKFIGSVNYSDWAPPANVSVKLIGEAVDGTAPGVICASFNAG